MTCTVEPTESAERPFCLKAVCGDYVKKENGLIAKFKTREAALAFAKGLVNERA